MYERPEIVEVGQAAELTLGGAWGNCPDACDCTKVCLPEQDVGTA